LSQNPSHPKKLHFTPSDRGTMALLTAFNIIRIIVVLHISIAYYFLFNPRIIAEQNCTYTTIIYSKRMLTS
jgi:hypothetical protein